MFALLNLPVLASEHGAEVDRLLVYFHVLMVALFVGWLAYFIFVLTRFRRSRQPRADHQGVRSHFSSYLEAGVAIAEACLLVFFAIPGWAKVVDIFPTDKDATTIRLVAQQFTWNFRYPGADGVFGKQDYTFASPSNPLGVDPQDPKGKDDFVSINQLYVPVGKPVIIDITSLDVIHSFKVPALRLTQDAIPGMSIPTHFRPTRTGSYVITCAQLCGNGHYAMKGQLNVLPQAEYDQWLAGKKQGGAASASYE